MPFDSVVNIGRQSLLDGVWRILQPALQSLGNPLPVTLPGMINAWVRVRAITPALSGSSADLTLQVDVEVLGDILLTASVKAGTVNLALPQGIINIPKPVPAGTFSLPEDDIEIALPDLAGPLSLAPGGTLTLSPVRVPPTPTGTPTKGHMKLPATDGTLGLPALSGTLNFIAGNLGNVGLPLPSVVPLALNLTPSAPARVPVTLPLTVAPSIDQASAFGLLLRLGTPTVRLPTLPAPGELVTAIVKGLERLLEQLGVTLPQVLPTVDPFGDKGPTSAEITATATALVAAAQAALRDVLTDALTGLTARTGRLIFPVPGAGATCETALLPTAATAQILLSPGGPLLQAGFYRTGVSAAPLTWPGSAPTAEVQITISNAFLLDLLSCLVEKLPNFTFLSPPGISPSSSAAAGRDCRLWQNVTLELWPLALDGSLELCLVGGSGSPKTVSLHGNFRQDIPNIVRFSVEFSLTLNLQLNDVTAVTGLRVASVSVIPGVGINPGVWALLIFAGVISLLVPGMAVLLIGLPLLLTAFIENLLRGSITTLLSRAHALSSPVAVPPGIFEAFGKLVPATMEIDDLTVSGSLVTPTAPWSLFSLEAPRFPTTRDTIDQPPIEQPTTTPRAEAPAIS